MADEYLNKSGLSRFWDKIKTKIPDITGKADKVSNATSGNFAGLDSNGNLTDSGHKHSDYLTQHQDISGKADKVSNATGGHIAGLDAHGNLIDSGHTLGANVPASAVFTDTTYSAGAGISISGTTIKNDGVRTAYLNNGSSNNFYYQYLATTEGNNPPAQYTIKGTAYSEFVNLNTTTFTFTDNRITSDSVIDVYTDTWGDNPSDVTVNGTNHTCTVTFSTSKTRSVRIYVK